MTQDERAITALRADAAYWRAMALAALDVAHANHKALLEARETIARMREAQRVGAARKSNTPSSDCA